MMSRIAIIVFFVLYVFQSKAGSDYSRLTDKRWVLSELKIGFNSDDVSYKNYYMVFHHNNEVTYQLDSCQGKLKIAVFADNKIAYTFLKTDELTYFGKLSEKIYQGIARAVRYRLTEDTLVLISDHSEITFVAQSFPDSKLTGTWTLAKFFHVEKEEAILPPEKIKKNVTIHFNDDGSYGTLDGESEKNNFTGKYSVADSTIKIEKITQPAKHEKCEWSNRFWEVIKLSVYYKTEGDALMLFYNDGREYMEFSRVD